MSFSLPPIVKLSERLLQDVELAVRRFPRFHKYTFGTTLREHAFRVASLSHQAWRGGERRAVLLMELITAIDDFKIAMQLGSRIRAFASFGQFEELARLAADLGKQTGGWHRQQHPKGQNAPTSSQAQRSQILSTRGASTYEANR